MNKYKCGLTMRKLLFIVYFSLIASFSIAAENVIVYEQDGKFCGWPANEGIWSWGDEILVGFNLGEYVYDDPGHDCNLKAPIEMVQARSLNGGYAWSFEKPSALSLDRIAKEFRGSINFSHPDLAIKLRNKNMWYSYDRGRIWEGPFVIPVFGNMSLKSRTDYIIDSQNCGLFFLTADKPDGEEGYSFCIKTSDSAKSFEFLSYIGQIPPLMKGSGYFTVQPSAVRIDKRNILCAVRERRDRKKWIDIYLSEDNGLNWKFLSQLVPSEEVAWNPPALLKLDNGMICMTWGRRIKPEGIRAILSSDNGKTWSKEIVLRDDGREWDLGYTRSVQRPDGKIVTVYYYTTKANPKQHIAATIWDASEYKKMIQDGIKND